MSAGMWQTTASWFITSKKWWDTCQIHIEIITISILIWPSYAPMKSNTFVNKICFDFFSVQIKTSIPITLKKAKKKTQKKYFGMGWCNTSIMHGVWPRNSKNHATFLNLTPVTSRKGLHIWCILPYMTLTQDICINLCTFINLIIILHMLVYVSIC